MFTAPRRHLMSLVLKQSGRTFFADKPNPKSLTQKQIEKQMSAKMFYPEKTQDDYIHELITIPRYLNRTIFGLQIPTILALINCMQNDFFSAGHTNSMNIAYDWLGFTIVAMSGACYGLIARNNWKNPRLKIFSPRSLFAVTTIPVMGCAISGALVYSMSPFSWIPIMFSMLYSLYTDSKATGWNLTPRYWFAYRIRATLFLNFFVIVTSFGLLTFREYIASCEKLLASYEALANPNTEKTDKTEGPKLPFSGPKAKPIFGDLVLEPKALEEPKPKSQLEVAGEERKKVLDILSDPSK